MVEEQLPHINFLNTYYYWKSTKLLDFNKYQELAKETDLGHPLNYYYLGLAEESGEVAGLRKRFLRDEGNTDYTTLTKELGDVL